MSTVIKAIAFDMDGVLIDAKDWHFEALNQALRMYGLQLSDEEHRVYFDGLPTREKLIILSQQGRLPEELHTSVRRLKQKFFFEIAERYCKPNRRHLEMLEQFKREGYRMGVCSNAVRPSVDMLLKKVEIDSYFEFYLSNEDVLKPKPNPEIYLKAIEIFELTPDEVMIVEDNENGLQSAWKTGAHISMVEGVDQVNYSYMKDCIEDIEAYRAHA